MRKNIGGAKDDCSISVCALYNDNGGSELEKRTRVESGHEAAEWCGPENLH